ncbi:hypothetical protein ACFL07_02210, partial [Pseudomonadota bacterium]
RTFYRTAGGCLEDRERFTTLPGADIVLISNEKPKTVNVDWYETDENAKDLDRFRKIYTHMSTNSENFERKCFERWFQLANWLEKAECKTAVHLESDVLLYFDYGQWVRKSFDADLIIIKDYNFHLMGILDTRSIRDFCNYILWMYEDADSLESLRNFQKWHNEKNGAGGVCDMTAMDKFRRLQKVNIESLFGVCDGRWIDNTVTQSDDFVMENGIKKGEFVNNRMMLTKNDSSEIEAGSLHFQGHKKCYMPKYVQNVPFAVHLEIIAIKTMSHVAQILNSLWRPWVLRYLRLVRFLSGGNN